MDFLFANFVFLYLKQNQPNHHLHRDNVKIQKMQKNI